MARHVLHDGHGTLGDKRDRHRMGAHAVARDAAGGVGGARENQTFEPMTTKAQGTPANRILALFKFGQRKHMEELVCDGHVFMRPLSDFIQLESDQLRGDKDEALTQFDAAADGGKLAVKMHGEWAPVGTITGGLKFSHPDTQRANVFCMYAFRASQAETLIDSRNLGFGDSFVVFTNGDEFLRRARAEAQRRNLELESGLVEYVDPRSYTGRMGVFRKLSTFAYQSEARLALLPGTGAPYSLRLGSLSDIAMIGNLSEINLRIEITREEASASTQPSEPHLGIWATTAGCAPAGEDGR